MLEHHARKLVFFFMAIITLMAIVAQQGPIYP